MNSSDWMRFTSLAGMGGRLLARQNGAGLGAAESITEEAGRVAGMCQESAVDSRCVAILSSVGRELGLLAGDDSKSSDGSDAGSNRGAPGEHTSMHDRARYSMRAHEHEDKRAKGMQLPWDVDGGGVEGLVGAQEQAGGGRVARAAAISSRIICLTASWGG